MSVGIAPETQDEINALERADRLLAEGVSGDRGGIASMIVEAVQHERMACADKAREYAEHYDQGSDGRNTFILLAEWIESRT